MKTDNPYVYVRNLNLIQQQAGVDAETAELVSAYAKLKADSGQQVVFHTDGTLSEKLLQKDPYLSVFLTANPDADPRWLDFLVLYTKTMAGRGLPTFFNTAHLADKFLKSENQLYWLLNNIQAQYKSYHIRKNGGGTRRLDAPQGELKKVQNRILHRILNKRKPHKFATAFQPGTNLLCNANPHVNRRVIVSLDIKDFFPSITHPQVRKVFQDFGYPYKVACTLASLCTLNGRLPQGAPTSPALSNFVCAKLDRRMAGLKKKMKFYYTRYADDMVFSSNNDRFTSLIPLLKEIIREEGFVVNEKKTRIMRAHQRQKVTGIVVNQKPNVPKEQRKQLRSASHRISSNTAKNVELTGRNPGTDPYKVYAGKRNFLTMVNPEQGGRLKTV